MSVRTTLSDLRGAAQLACDSTIGITGVVEQVHGTIMGLPLPLGPMRQRPDAGLARLVYGSIRGTTRLVDLAVGTALGPWVNGATVPAGSPQREAFLAALNGVIGDHLARTGNPLAVPMTLRVECPGHSSRSRRPRRWLLLAHGLCMNDQQWNRKGHDHGRALARDLGLTPVYLRYNSGLGVDENGTLLAQQLEQFLQAHGTPSDEVVVLAFSLGGLVTRSALAAARQQDLHWVGQVRQVAFLGTPHRGAPLAVGGHAVDRALGVSPYSAAFAKLGGARSRGLHDLRDGLGPGLEELPSGVATFALAGALAGRRGRLGDACGDGLVPVTSALARPADRTAKHAIPTERQWVSRGSGHLGLLNDRGVYRKLMEWLA